MKTAESYCRTSSAGFEITSAYPVSGEGKEAGSASFKMYCSALRANALAVLSDGKRRCSAMALAQPRLIGEGGVPSADRIAGESGSRLLESDSLLSEGGQRDACRSPGWGAQNDVEHEVAARTADLAASLQRVEAFSYSVAHDLRAPLRTISGFVGLLKEEEVARLSHEGQRHLAVIDETVRHMGHLVDSLLSLATTSRCSIKRTRVDLHATVQAIAVELSREYPAATVVVNPMPPIEGDAILLRQLLSNLIGNALKYSSRSAHPLVDVSAQFEGGEMVVRVADNGIGFDMQQAGRLFQPFGRLHAQSDYRGTGIGLALSKLIVERHGGRIWADSQPGQGARFCFSVGQDEECRPHGVLGASQD